MLSFQCNVSNTAPRAYLKESLCLTFMSWWSTEVTGGCSSRKVPAKHIGGWRWRTGGAPGARQSSPPAVRRSHVSCHGFDVTRDGIAQLKAYQCVSKSAPFSLDTSNKRLSKRPAQPINLSACACQPWVTAGAEKPATERELNPGKMTKSMYTTSFKT